MSILCIDEQFFLKLNTTDWNSLTYLTWPGWKEGFPSLLCKRGIIPLSVSISPCLPISCMCTGNSSRGRASDWGSPFSGSGSATFLPPEWHRFHSNQDPKEYSPQLVISLVSVNCSRFVKKLFDWKYFYNFIINNIPFLSLASLEPFLSFFDDESSFLSCKKFFYFNTIEFWPKYIP